MSDEVKALTERVAELERELARVTRRVNVALELIGECRVTGYPESVGIVEQRLEQAERADSFTSQADDTTATSRPAVSVGATEPSLDPPAAMGKAKWEPFVPGEAPLAGRRASMPEAVKPLAQQAQRYDHQTEQERKTDRALDALEGLGKLKK